MSESRLVEVDESSFEVSSSGMVTGGVWIQLGDYSFPEQRWNDFVVVVMSWWCEALNGLVGSDASAVCRFMDGPYEFHLSYKDADTIGISFAEGAKRGIVREAVVDRTQFLTDLRFAAKRALGFCNNQRITNADIINLRRQVRLLK